MGEWGKFNCEWGLCVGEGTDWQSAVGGLFLTGDSSIRLVPAGSLSVDRVLKSLPSAEPTN